MDLLVEERPARARPQPPDERADLLATVLREPGSPEALVRLAEFADGAGDWRTAEWCWRRLLLIDDRSRRAHAGLATALAGQGRCAAAEGALACAWTLLPGEVEIGARFARTAEARADWPEALRRWQAVLLAFSHLPAGYLGLGSAMRAMGRPDEARRVLEQGAARFPAEPELPHDLARLAEARADWPEAERRWRRRLALRADCPAAAGLARALLMQGRGPEAAAALRRCAPVILEADPERLSCTALLISEHWSPALRPLMLELERALEPHAGETATRQVCLAYAVAARRRGDLSAFRRRAEAMGRRFEGDRLADRLALEAREPARQEGRQSPADLGGERRRPRRELSTGEVALRFESLGGGGLDADGWAFGCEFGFFQRRAGVEPLGLLRWASIPPDQLIRALERRFEGLEDPAQLELVEHGGSDWGVMHRPWTARFDHSGLDRGSVGREEAMRRIVRSFVLLKRKLLEDLAAAEKIFVYRCYDHVLPDAALDRLVAALASHGDATLLYVAEASAFAPPLTVERRGPRLLYGRIDRFAPQNHQLIYNDCGWEAVCRGALREHEPRAADAAAPRCGWPADAAAART